MDLKSLAPALRTILAKGTLVFDDVKTAVRKLTTFEELSTNGCVPQTTKVGAFSALWVPSGWEAIEKTEAGTIFNGIRHGAISVSRPGQQL